MHSANKRLILLIILCTFCAIEAQKKCATKETCGACIRELGCVWCNSPFSENSTNIRRCLTLQESNSPDFCASENIINPKSSVTIIQQLPIETSSSHGKQPVQISPQRIKISLRQGEEYNLRFKYAQAKDYPVDLYYIMDLSASMEKHRDKLSKLGTKLAETMNALTKQFRLGFGSFVDKVEMPFTSTVREKLQSPCTLDGGKPCASPYSFKNHLSLTNRTELFTQQVENAIVSGNLDSPEGGLDALMQAMVCQDEIGWRPKARHLLVFSTDASFHIAGDGKLAGIVHPHDGRCYMSNNVYTHSLLLDYPSIGHINQKAIEHNMNVIFAVEDKQTEIYTRLKNQIREASIGTLSGDSSNVVDLVKNVYDKIVDSVKITDNSDSNIEIKYFSSCNSESGDEKETSECKNLKVDVKVDFRANIKLVSCPSTQNKTRIFEIKPGALNESLIVELEMLCDCDCERNNEQNAPECYNSGSLECGICNCDAGKYGRSCECDGLNSTLSDVSDDCKLEKNSDVICSGYGTCKCNKCDCYKRPNEGELIYGKFCECNNYSCKRYKGVICSGPEQGKCECGKCRCEGGWGGEACECGTNSTCIKDGKVCSDHGDCKCGICECHLVDGNLYTGTHCETCAACGDKLCNELQHCVECKAYKTGIYNEEECYKHCTKKVNIIDHIEEEKRLNEKQCYIMDKNDCSFQFKFWYDSNKDLNIFAVREKSCKLNIFVLVCSIIGSIILAGIIALLLWKGVTTVHDRREYARFENERKYAKWNNGENPLFRNPTTTIVNPTYTH